MSREKSTNHLIETRVFIEQTNGRAGTNDSLPVISIVTLNWFDKVEFPVMLTIEQKQHDNTNKYKLTCMLMKRFFNMLPRSKYYIL